MGQNLNYSPGRGNLLQPCVAPYVGEELERWQCHCLAAGGLFSTCPVSSHFTPFFYATGTPQASALVVVPWVSECAHVLGLHGPFKNTLPRNQRFLPPPQPPLLLQPEVKRLYFPSAATLGGWDRSLPRCPCWFLSTSCECGTACFTSHCCRLTTTATPHSLCPGSQCPPLLPIWMDMALNSWLLDFHKFDFPAVLGVFCFEVSYDPSYGCARRWSVSTCTSILTGSPAMLLITPLSSHIVLTFYLPSSDMVCDF